MLANQSMDRGSPGGISFSTTAGSMRCCDAFDPGTSYTVVPRGVAAYFILNEDTLRNTRDRSITHTAWKDEFRQNLRSHSWMESIFTVVVLMFIIVVVIPFIPCMW